MYNQGKLYDFISWLKSGESDKPDLHIHQNKMEEKIDPFEFKYFRLYFFLQENYPTQGLSGCLILLFGFVSSSCTIKDQLVNCIGLAGKYYYFEIPERSWRGGFFSERGATLQDIWVYDTDIKKLF